MPTATLAPASTALLAPARTPSITLSIGTLAVCLATPEPAFLHMLQERYLGFADPTAQPDFHFDVQLASPRRPAPHEDLLVTRSGTNWCVRRGDFLATWDSRTRRGWLRQSANPYSSDTLLRVVHSIALAEKGGFLLHAASAVRNGRAFLFSGVSGAGKTTLSRLAPPDVRILTDEISYVVKEAHGYRAYGTPFAGELARVGENISAPIAGLYFLDQAPRNRLVEADSASALRALLRNTLFLAKDDPLVRRLFQSAVEFISAVPVRRMQFTRDSAAWGLIA